MPLTKDYKSKQAHDYELIAMCYHEAGHAIVAIFNFMKVFSVSVMNNKQMDGSTEWDGLSLIASDPAFLNLLLINDVEISYAGFIAEKIYYKDICGSDTFPRTLKYGSELDIFQASKVINKYNLAPPGRERFLFKKRIQESVNFLLTENWDAVKMVAHNLYKKRNLNFDELKYVLTRKTKNKFLWKEKYKHIQLIYDHKNEIKESELKIILAR